MKKITVTMMIFFIFAGLSGVSQESKTGNVKKKQKFCSANITLMDKSFEKFALGGFADDSIIIFPIQMINNHPLIQVEGETRIAATGIKKIAIRIEKVRSSTSIYSNDSVYKKKANDSIASALKKIKSGEVARNTGNTIDVFLLPSDPFSAVFGIMLLPVLIPTFILISKEKVYRINGNPEKLDRMREKLTDKKPETKNI